MIFPANRKSVAYCHISNKITNVHKLPRKEELALDTFVKKHAKLT